MAKKNQATPAAPVLFPIEGYTANRATVRSVSSNPGDHLRKVELSIIRIRPRFNPRSRNRDAEMSEELWEQSILIPDLADKIYVSNGPAHAILGDIHEDGNFYITDGERRFRALKHLIASEREIYPNGDPVNVVLVMLNPPGTTDAERKKKAVAANDNLPLTPIQLAKHYLSFQEEEGWTLDQIAEECCVSRQTVGNYIMAATELPQAVQDAIDRGEVKMTNALVELRKAKKHAKNTGGAQKTEDDEPIITGALADKLGKEEKENEKLRGDEDEFEQKDNSITFAGSMSGPSEDKSSGAIVLGKDAIYSKTQREASLRQLIHRYNRVFENACKLILPDKPEDEQDEERAAALYDKRMKHTISKLAEEYDVTVR